MKIACSIGLEENKNNRWLRNVATNSNLQLCLIIQSFYGVQN